MAGIPEDVIERIKIAADITDVIESYVPTLKRNGKTYKACCPFHQEKTPSFVVNPERQVYKCFGCGKGGNVFSFIMDMENLDFPNAARMLGRKYGIDVPENEPWRGRNSKFYAADPAAVSSVPEADYSLRERLYQLHELLAMFYNDNLHKRTVPAVSDYFATRNIPVEFTNSFQIGASPDSWDAAVNLAHSRGFTDAELIMSGVVSEKENSNHFYDRFRNRLMFPIWNEQGRVVAFSARTVEANPDGWKYVNSPETPIFKKSRTLYALHIARKKISELGFAILCEGQIDVIAMHRAGSSNAVAAQGTAFTNEHAMILKRYTSSVTLALDSDKAGREAVFKDAAILLPLGFTVKVADYGTAKDADDLLASSGAQGVAQVIENAIDFYDFALKHELSLRDTSTPSGKSALAIAMIKYILLADNSVTRTAYLEWLSSNLGMNFEALKAEFDREDLKIKQLERNKKIRADLRAAAHEEQLGYEERKSIEKPLEKPLSDRIIGLKKAFCELLELILADEEYAARAVGDITHEMLDASPEGIALESVIQSKMNEEWEHAAETLTMELSKRSLDVSQIAGLLVGTEDKTSLKHASSNPRNSLKGKAFTDKTYADCLKIITRENLIARRDGLIKHAREIPDGPEKLAIMKEVLECSQLIRNT